MEVIPSFQKDHKLVKHRFVQPIFCIVVCTGLFRKVPGHIRKGISRNAVHKKEGRRRDHKQCEEHINDSSCNKLFHILFPLKLCGSLSFHMIWKQPTTELKFSRRLFPDYKSTIILLPADIYSLCTHGIKR